ncbi:LLM class flavin-dependent oxidoreductase [Microbacterium sp.]|uniref:LLM class flavin-dependent oxidoreductase n=1 Tax=Microbacterium sp. TaxID=51671 RepID=UPI0025F77905|nr:LLM class flavin-dependent oxidoreductase [Microbacterium sp.]
MSTAPFPALSVLDLVPVRTAQSSAQAVAASLDLATHADRLGYRRYWFAEHHNMPAVASTTPPVLVAAAAARTTRIRVGSGGVMLPNHAPLIVAEQFAALEAIAPGRVDLGLGRAPGSDPVITQLLRMSGTTSEADRFPEHVRDILSFLTADGATLRLVNSPNQAPGRTYDVHATPAATGMPDVWLLGSSDYSAQLAAAFGLPYVFANHFSGEGLERAVDLYRTRFQPSEILPVPRTFLTANVIAADSDVEAEERMLPQARMMSRLRGGHPLIALETVEQAAAAEAGDGLAAATIDGMRSRWFVGTGPEVRDRIAVFAARYGVDEVMVSPVAGAYDNEPMDRADGRIQTLELLAG